MLADKIRDLSRRGKASAVPLPRPHVDERPGCAFGAVTGQRVGDLANVVNRIEGKVNAILGGVAVAVLVEIIRSFAS